MNLSQKRVLDLIKRYNIYDVDEMAFILTVLKSDCEDDDLKRFIEILIGELKEKSEYF